MSEEKTVEQIVAEAIEPDFKKQFIRGMEAGWQACCVSLYKQIKNMTSAKTIKKVLKQKCEEAETRLGSNQSQRPD